MRWYVDDVPYSTKTGWWSCGERNAGGAGEPPSDAVECNPFPASFDRPFYLTMMQNVGGTLPGAPDESTPFPSDMLVDYVRVFDRVDGYGEKVAEQATGADSARRGAARP